MANFTKEMDQEDMKELMPNFWRIFFYLFSFAISGIFFSKEGSLNTGIFMGLLIAFVLVLNEAHRVSYKKTAEKIQEMNSHSVHLENFIRCDLLYDMNKSQVQSLSIGLVDKYMSERTGDLPANLLNFFCSKTDTYKVFRKAVIDKLKYLDECLSSEMYKSSINTRELTFHRRRMVENLLIELEKEFESQNPNLAVYSSKLDGTEGKVSGITIEA